jgi:hypothetical protein
MRNMEAALKDLEKELAETCTEGDWMDTTPSLTPNSTLTSRRVPSVPDVFSILRAGDGPLHPYEHKITTTSMDCNVEASVSCEKTKVRR